MHEKRSAHFLKVIQRSISNLYEKTRIDCSLNCGLASCLLVPGGSERAGKAPGSTCGGISAITEERARAGKHPSLRYQETQPRGWGPWNSSKLGYTILY
jgi:hypothetical protein